MKTVFKSLKGRIEKDSSFFGFEVENGNNNNSIGDQVWFSPKGDYMEVYEYIQDDVLEDLLECFKPESRRPLRGALRRVGILID